eukprot:2101235-Amphidinium_carterae.1
MKGCGLKARKGGKLRGLVCHAMTQTFFKCWTMQMRCTQLDFFPANAETEEVVAQWQLKMQLKKAKKQTNA